MSAYIDYLLLDRFAFGTQVAPSFNTTELTLDNGQDRRNAKWSRPKHVIDAPFQGLTKAQMDAVRDVFMVCQGRARSFRVFDRSDFRLTDEVIGTADGTTDQTIQLIKTYTVYGLSTVRTITKPVDSTRDYGRGTNAFGAAPALVIKAAGTPISFSCDYTTGIITLTGTLGEEITATGWFDVPMRFDDDRLFFSVDNKDQAGGDYTYSSSVNLIEDWAA